MRYIFKNLNNLRGWLQEKNFNAGSPEAFSEWLSNFLEEGNELMVDGCTDPYDYLDCMELV